MLSHDFPELTGRNIPVPAVGFSSSSNLLASVGNTTQPTTKPVVCSIDWVQGIVTLPAKEVSLQLTLFSLLFREEGTLIDCIGKSFGSTKYPFGAMTLNKQRFAWSETDDSGMVKLWLSIPGGALERVDSLTALKGLNSILSRYEFRASRIDLAIDDYDKILDPVDFDVAAINQAFVGNPKITPIGYANEPGFTRYVGSRRSLAFARFYDKSAQSNGVIDAYRLEAEFKGRVAAEHYLNLVAIAELGQPEAIGAYIVEAVTGMIRVSDGTDSQKYLCGVAPWWQKFLNHCQCKGGFRVAQPRRESSLSKTMQWLERSVKSSLATVKQALGSERFQSYFDKLMKDGKAARSTNQLHILKLLNRGDDMLPVKKPKLKPSKGFTDLVNATQNVIVNATQNKTVNTATNAMMNRIVNATRNTTAMQ